MSATASTARTVPFDLGSFLRRSIAEHSSDTALIWEGQSRSFAELGVRVDRLAGVFSSLGLNVGDRVAILLTNRIEYPEIDVALASAGLIRVALNVRLGVEEHAFVIEDSGARTLISEAAFDETTSELHERFGLDWLRIGGSASVDGARDYETELAGSPGVRAYPDISPLAPAWYSYTSGTTGKPKGVVLSHRSLVNVSFNIMLELGPVAPGYSVLLPQPLSHGAGYFILPYLAAGGMTCIASKFDPEEMLWLGEQHRITTFKCVPTMLVDLLDLDEDLPFETVIYGAAPMSLPHVERAVDRWGPVIMQLYGQSEAPMTITVLHKADLERPGPHRGSTGRPWRTVDVAVCDNSGNPVPVGELGEVVVTGDHIMDGYLGLPELTREVIRDGQVWTKDMAIRDDEGYVYLRGRRDEMIISGGFNISPKEVEDVVGAHPDVRECLALGVPDDRWGQLVQIHVVPVEGRVIDEAALLEFCKPQLGFRRPKSVILVDDFPRSAYGKLDRKAHAEAVARLQQTTQSA